MSTSDSSPVSRSPGPRSKNRPEKLKNDKQDGRSPARRSQARTVAFQILYQEDMNPGSAAQFGEEYATGELPDNEQLRIFCRMLISGTRLHKQEIDERLGATAAHWTVARMAATDRNILRLAMFEMLYQDTPKPVVINEAVELAKTFGSVESAAFVNGILDKIRRALEPEKPRGELTIDN